MTELANYLHLSSDKNRKNDTSWIIINRIISHLDKNTNMYTDFYLIEHIQNILIN